MGNGNSQNILSFQTQQLENIRKSILTILTTYKYTLTSVTKKVFGFQREEFDTNQLAYLLNKINNKFGFQQASIIMKGLGVEGKIIQLQDLDLFLNQIDKKVHPLQKKFEEFRQIVKQQGCLIYLQSLDFDGDNYLQISGMGQVFNLLEFTEVQKEYILGKIFKNKKIVSIPDILVILNITEKEMNEDSKPCSLMLLSKSKNLQFIDNQFKMPPVLEHLLNLNIKVSQQLINWLSNVVASRKRFVDSQKPKIKPQHQYVHISKLYPQYFLFEMSTSNSQQHSFKNGQGLLIEAKNIRQGHGKDCYILSALSGVVQIYPEHIYNLFLIDKTEVDVYVVKLFIDGVWELIVLDAEFPINKKNKLVYAQPSKYQIWVLLIEKAWAKIFGSYINIQQGSNEEGLIAVTGAPCLRFQVNKSEQLDMIPHYLGKGYIASVSTNNLNNMSKQDQKKLGIYANHAYTLLYIFPNVTDALTNQSVTLLYLRNPWGRGAWRGTWSFNYSGWSQQMRKKVSYMKNPKDGSFFMSLEDFKKYFSKIKVCCFHPQYVNSSLRISSNAHKYIANKFTIKRKGDYFLSMYQQSKRKYKNTGVDYKLSDSNIFVAKIRQGGCIEPIGSKAVNNNNLSIESTYQPGDYVCVTRVKWINKQQGQFTLTSYGPQILTFKPISIKQNFFAEFIRLKAHDEIGDKSYYGKHGSPKSYKIVFMSHEHGYGYILICNNEQNRCMKGLLSLQAAKGIKMIPPLTLKIRIDIKPKTRQVYPCLVSSSGYEYKILEEMALV